jgi:cytochrome b
MSYIWTLPTRIFHWLLVIYFATAYLTSEVEWLLPIHAAAGYGVAILVLFRIFWGFWGPRYARFRDWPLGLKELREFLKDPSRPYPSHNPAASWVMLGIIVSLALTTLTGVLTYGIQEGRGILAFLHAPHYEEMELFEELHEFFANLSLMLVFIHLAGVALDRLLHKEHGVLESMITGYKRIEAPSARLNFWQKAMAAIFLSAAIIVPIWAMSADSPLGRSVYEPVEYDSLAPEFSEECGSCHTLYPPFLLPKASWQKVMATLEDHFGDDASLDEETRRKIEEFLLANAAEHSTKEAAFYIKKSISHLPKPPIAITETPYWKARHKEIDERHFKAAKSLANCKACHKDIEMGMIEDANISLAEVKI